MMQQQTSPTTNVQIKLITDARKLLEKVRSQQCLSADSSLDSKQHVSSRSAIFFESLSTNTTSGLWPVHKISGGTVLPFIVSPGRSASISMATGFTDLRTDIK